MAQLYFPVSESGLFGVTVCCRQLPSTLLVMKLKVGAMRANESYGSADDVPGNEALGRRYYMKTKSGSNIITGVNYE